jgi:hypothetical protein
LTASDFSNLPPRERAAVALIEQGDFEEGLRAFLASSYPRLRAALLAHFTEIDLDTAFVIQETADERLLPFKQILWDGDELTEFGDAFFCWAEDPDDQIELALTPGEFRAFLNDSRAFYESVESELPPQVESGTRFSSPDEETLSLGDLPRQVAARAASEKAAADKREATEGENPEIVSFGIPVQAVDMPLDHVRQERVVAEILAVPPSPPEPEWLGPSGDVPTEIFELLSQPSLTAEPPGEAPQNLPAEPDVPENSAEVAAASQLPEPEERPADVAPEPIKRAEPERPVQRIQKLHPAAAIVRDEMPEEGGEVLAFSRAPLSPLEKKTQLVVRNKFLGYGKNSEGVVGLCGQLRVSYFEEKELVGRLESSNPLLFFQPDRLSGSKATVTYWLPPVAFPHPAGQLTIQTPHESKILTLHSLFPKSRTDYMSDGKVLMCLLAPALIGILYFGFVYLSTVHGIDQEAQSLFPELYEMAMDGVDTVDFRAGGLGLYRLKVVPAAESLQMIWAAVLLLAPLAAGKFFYYLSKPRQRRFGGALAAALLLPTFCLLLTWNYQGTFLPLYDHKDFAPLDLRSILTWSIPANIAVASYLFLSVYGVWDRFVKPREVRIALPFLLTAVYFFVMFLLIFGRSWVS